MKNSLLFISLFISFSFFAQSRKDILLEAHQNFSDGKASVSLEPLNNLLQKDIKNNDTASIIEDLFMLSKANRLEGKLFESLNHILKINKYDPNSLLVDSSKTAYEFSSLAFDAGAYKIALEMKLNHLSMFKEYNMARFYEEGFIGGLYIRLKQVESSKPFFEKQLETAQNMNDRNLMIQAKNNLGYYHQLLNEYDSAVFYYTDIISNHHNKDNYSYHNTCGNLGTLYLNLKDYKNAVKYLGIDYYKYKTISSDYLRVAVPLMEAYIGLNNKDSLNIILSESRLGYEQAALDSKISFLLFLITNSLSTNLKEDIELYNKLLIIREDRRVLKEKNKEKLISLFFEEQLNLLQAASERTQELHDNKIKLSKRRLQLSLIGVFLVGLLLIALIIIFVFYRKNTRYKSEINRKEQTIIKEQLKLKERSMVDLAMDIKIRKELSEKIYSQIANIDFNDRILAQQKLNGVLAQLDDFENVSKPLALIKENVDHISSSFYDKLEQLHPNLTVYEKELCSLIRMGIGNKEISQIKKIEPASVATSKNRLKKKLNISQDLGEYLKNL